jgi:hypothetical protein
MEKSQRAMNLLGVPWVVVPETCELVQDHLTNEIGGVLRTKGPGRPEVLVNPSIHPEVMQRIMFIFEKMFEVSGLSQLSATAKKPAGVESGVALRTLLDTETQRFALLVDAWQEFHLELARLTVKTARRMSRDVAVPFHDKEIAREVQFSDVDLEESQYRMQLWPVNLLPETPAGKLAYVEQMITIGLIDPDQGRSLLDYPDIEAFQRLQNAAVDDIHMLIDHFLSTGDYIPPLPYQNLGLGINLFQAAWLRGRIDGYTDDRLGLLVRWMDEANRILNERETAMKQLAPPPGPSLPQGQPPQPGIDVPPPMPPAPEMSMIPPEAMQGPPMA